MKRWYEIKAQADVSEIWLYDEIGIFGIGAKEFIVELNAIQSPAIDMHVNSPGGEVFDGAAIYNAIRRHPAKVTTYIDGIAASIASVIALAGDRVVSAENGIYMMHNPHGVTFGNAADMRKTADILDKVRGTMIGAYVAKSGKSEEEITELLDAETWMNAEEAVAAGFVDEIGEEMDLAACAKFVPAMNRMGFAHIPRVLTDKRELPTERDMERALREGAGCSLKQARAIAAQAKLILAGGDEGHLRDEGPPPEPPAEAPPRDVAQPKPARPPIRIVDRHLRPRHQPTGAQA